MKRLARWWAAWVSLLDRREPGDALAIFRVLVSAVVLYSLLTIVTHSLTGVLWVDRAWGGYRALGAGTTLVKWLGGPTPGVVRGVVGVTVVSAALLLIGLGGRVAAFVTLQGYMALHRLDSHSSGSSDLLVTNALLLLLLSRSTATLSVDCKRRTGRFTSEEAIPAWPRYLAILQLTAMYWSTGVQKLSVYWFPAGSYSALYYVLQQPSWQRFSMSWAARVYPLTQAATAVTWIWEATAPVLLLVYYFRDTRDREGRLRRWMNRFDLRVPWALVGVTLHALIFIAMDVGHFTLIALSFYVCLWHPEELRAAGRRLRGWVTRGGGARAPQAPPPAPPT